MTITPPTLADLTTATVAGTGVFDVLMRANKAHLDEQFTLGRIKGAEYATVYLGSLEQVLNSSVQFLLTKDKIGLEATLLEKQIALADSALLKAAVDLDIAETQLLIAVEQKLNIEAERTVLVATECKLRAEYDVLMETKLKTAQETLLLTWKVTTEKAQTSDVGVSADSVIGKQKVLYQAQSDGFARDAEQKTAKVMVDSWNVRRTTDEATTANVTNKLDDAAVGRAVEKLLTGVGA